MINQIWNPEVFRSKGFKKNSLCRGICEKYFTFLPSRAANRQIHSEYFNHCLTKQIEYSWKRQTKGIIYLASVLNNIRCNKQIYHVWEGYLRKIPVLRLNIPRHSVREIFRLSTSISQIPLPNMRYLFKMSLVCKWCII